ncbi:MAG: hypothetical protein H0X37_03680 [Herpetosiphonaceae bacterium]|nr:hypothetical protein [Herpetosiphonaceae bacterium]
MLRAIPRYSALFRAIPFAFAGMKDAQLAAETFTMLMGNLVPPRKKFIQTHSLEVENVYV